MTRSSDDAVVLLSGGQDSTTVLYWARERYRRVHALTMAYGQRHSSELAAAALIAARAEVASHVLVHVPELLDGSRSALIATSGVAVAARGGMKDREAPGGLPTTFVPARNLLLFSAAVARAGVVGAHWVCAGVCQTDYSGYPDCREQFVGAFQQAVTAGWPSGHAAPEMVTPLMHLSKVRTVELARTLPGCMEALADSVTCYHGQRPGCGACPACELRSRGFAEAGVLDPARTA